MNELVAKKIELYRPTLSKEALEYLLVIMQDKNADEAHELLDTMFTNETNYDLDTMKESIEKLTSIKHFDPIEVTTFVNINELKIERFNRCNEIEQKIRIIREEISELTKQPELFRRELVNEWGFDLELAYNEDENLEIPSPKEIFATLHEPVQLETIENNPKLLYTSICEINGNYLFDGEVTLEFKPVLNYSQPTSFITDGSLIVVTGIYIENIFEIYNLATPFIQKHLKELQYKIPYENNNCFIIVKNLKSLENAERLAKLKQILSPSFVVFTNDYIIDKGEENITIEQNSGNDYTFPTRLSEFSTSVQEIYDILNIPCVFVTNHYNSATPPELFEQISLEMDNELNIDQTKIKITSDPVYFNFGNTRFLLIAEEQFQALESAARFPVNELNDYENEIQSENVQEITINNEVLQDTISLLEAANPLNSSFYVTMLQQESAALMVDKRLFCNVLEEIDCIVTCEDFEKFNFQIYSRKIINCCDFEYGATVVFGMGGDAGCFYAEI